MSIGPFVQTDEYELWAILSSTRLSCLPFLTEDKVVGVIRPDIWEHLKSYSNLLHKRTTGTKDTVVLNPELKTADERTAAVAKALQELRAKNVFKALAGWRDEEYDVWHKLSEPPLMRMERTATSLFGVVQCGVHINGYTDHPEHGLSMWIAKRSKTKPTWPSKLDQMSAGGLPAGMGKLEGARKECQEEASVPDHLLHKLQFVGSISYTYEDERGVFHELQYVLDLPLPLDFDPVNSDGEAESFQLVPLTQLKDIILYADFKPNCAMVVLHFLIRHGYITPDNEPEYQDIVTNMHNPLGFD